MIDGIIKADGTSRLMRATLPPTYEEFKTQAAAGTLPLDIMFNEAGWSQIPTFLNKANLLKDPTANLFGLGANAVPNAVLSWIGQYNTHWWSVLHGEASVGYEENREATGYGFDLVTRTGGSTILVADAVDIDQNTGVVTLSSPSSVFINTRESQQSSVVAQVNALVGKYISNVEPPLGGTKFTTDTIFYITSTPNVSGSSGAWSVQCYNTTEVVNSRPYNIPAGATTYEHSTDRNAYPDSGTVDGLTYQYLGVPFQKFPTMPQIATGSYTGTGTYGASNPNVLTFGFVPKLVICYLRGRGLVPYSEYFNGAFVWLPTVASIKSGSNKSSVFTQNGNTLTWYTEYGHGDYQFNGSGNTYDYIAIG